MVLPLIGLYTFSFFLVRVCLFVFVLFLSLLLFCSPFNRSERVKHCKDILIFLWGLVKSRIAMIFYFIFKGLSHLIPTM